MTPPFGVALGVAGHMYSSRTTTSPSARTGYHFMPKPDVFGFIAPSAGSSVTAVAPLADSHLSNDASEPVAVPSKMYSKPGSGGGAVYCACAEGANASAMSAVSAMRYFMGPPSLSGAPPEAAMPQRPKAYAFRVAAPKFALTRRAKGETL